MYHRIRDLFILAISGLGIGWMISACGQKGYLYLPEPEPAQQTAVGTKTGAARQTKVDGKAAVETGPVMASEVGQPGQE